jgi:hypothetical protein
MGNNATSKKYSNQVNKLFLDKDSVAKLRHKYKLFLDMWNNQSLPS